MIFTNKIFHNFKHVWDYVPFILIMFLFVAETEIDTAVIGKVWNMVLGLGVILITYVLLMILKIPRVFAVMIATIVWIGFIVLKKIVIKNITV